MVTKNINTSFKFYKFYFTVGNQTTACTLSSSLCPVELSVVCEWPVRGRNMSLLQTHKLLRSTYCRVLTDKSLSAALSRTS